MTSHKIKKITGHDESSRLLCEKFTDEFCSGYITVGEDETCLPEYYANYAQQINDFEIRNSDVIVSSHPKTGTTWTQEMVWLIANDLDFKGAETIQKQRFPFFEVSTLFDFQKIEKAKATQLEELFTNSLGFIQKQKSPRFIKTHLPFSLLPQEIQNGSKSPKIIYVMRNPKDVCVSYYHHHKLLQPTTCNVNLEEFCQIFLDGKMTYGPFWKNILGYWNQKNLPNLLIIKYEDLKKNLPAAIRKVAQFLEKQLTDKQVAVLAQYLSFESMQNNPAVNYEDMVDFLQTEGRFMRSGTVGKYKEEMSAEIIQKFDLWIKKNVAGTSLEREYDFNL